MRCTISVDRFHIEPFVERAFCPAAMKHVDQRQCGVAGATEALRTDDARRGREHAVRRVARFAGRFRRRELGRSVQIQLRGNRDVHQLAIVLAAGLV